jgi:hypothetical protein
MPAMRSSSSAQHIHRCLAVGLAAAALGLPPAATASTVSLLNNGDFETAVSTALTLSWNSSVYGKWAVGDPMTTTGAVNGITPVGGSLMMDFSPTGGISADVYQIVDLTAYAAQIDAGLVTVDTSAYFDAVSAARVGMALLRWTAAPTQFSGYTLLEQGTPFLTDGNKSTWERFGFTGVALSAGTRYLGFGLNSPTNAPQTYADNASLLLHINDGLNGTPEPGTLPLIGAALLGLSALRRRRTR